MLHCLFIVAAYAFPVGQHSTYEVNVSFDGYLPILGGRVAKSKVEMDVDAWAEKSELPDRLRIVSEIRSLKLTYNGAVMPFGTANIQEFFPKSTAEMTLQGRVVKTDAPDVKLPVRLPGLDPKRFPEISYAPVEFPAEDLVVGKHFKFKKAFGDSMVDYDVSPKSVDGEATTLEIAMTQSYTEFEDSHHKSVETSSDGFKIATDVQGHGEAIFNSRMGRVTKFDVIAESDSEVENLATHEKTHRKLTTHLIVKVKSAS